jgi:hypothetical protein
MSGDEAPVRLVELAVELGQSADILEFLEPDEKCARDHVGFRVVSAARARQLLRERDAERWGELFERSSHHHQGETS